METLVPSLQGITTVSKKYISNSIIDESLLNTSSWPLYLLYTYLQNFSCDELPTDIAGHTEYVLVARFTVRLVRSASSK